MTMKPRLTIITPVYNGRAFIESCIINVVQQHCADIEHLLLDGCSTDGTVAIIREYAEKYQHLRWTSEKDSGQADAMNKGLGMARGDIVGFLNVDDYYAPNTLPRIVEIFNELPEPSLLVGNCNVIRDDGNITFVNKPAKLKFAQLLAGPAINPWPINPSAYFYHKSLHDITGPYKIDEHYALDVDFLLRAVQVAHVRYIDEVWGNFRLIAGTKTYIDQEIDKNVGRYKRILDLYKSNLPWLIRSIFPVYRSWQRIVHWSGYLKNPRLFMTVLKNKMKRFLGAT
jgi:glycosyltransferase involved in cell wall biosynthesis